LKEQTKTYCKKIFWPQASVANKNKSNLPSFVTHVLHTAMPREQQLSVTAETSAEPLLAAFSFIRRRFIICSATKYY
jgi:hypothetical protein